MHESEWKRLIGQLNKTYLDLNSKLTLDYMLIQNVPILPMDLFKSN